MTSDLNALLTLSFADFLKHFKSSALTIHQQLLASKQYAAAMNVLGLILLDKQQYIEARLMLEKAIQLAPQVSEYYLNLGTLYEVQQELEKAEQYYHLALTLDETKPDSLLNLAYVLQLQLKYAEAIPLYQQALPYTEQQTRALVNLGKCLQETQKLTAASACYQLTLELDPHHAIALHNLAGLKHYLGATDSAIELYRRSIASQADLTFNHYNLGVVLMLSGQFVQAEQALLKVLGLDAQHKLALQSLGDLYAFQGQLTEANVYYQLLLAIQDNPGLRIRIATLVPPIPASSSEIEQFRQSLRLSIQQFQSDPSLKLVDPVVEIRDAFFYLSYHGEHNRKLKTDIAHLFAQICPDLLWTAPHCLRPYPSQIPIKIGIISKYLHIHSIGKTTLGFFSHLPRSLFKVYAIFIPPMVNDSLSSYIQEQADENLIVAADLATARQQIAQLELDILFYQDIGMDPFSYFLAYARLAPVQCTSFGHPDTTGIGNMDYFISSPLFETVHATAHYSETLYLLPPNSLLSYYERPTLPTPLKSRAELGWSTSAHLYICPQTLFKFHPAFDHILAEILRRDKLGKIILIEGPIQHFAQLLQQRWHQFMPDVEERLIWLPAQTSGDFINLLAVADVMLDIPSFNGMNSSLEAFSVGTPVVTLPGELQRMRHGAGLYQKMGVAGAIAKDTEDYIQLAIRIAENPVLRQQLSAQILANNHLLYADDACIEAFSQFFVRSRGL
jgi:predicted O-linked N-acetylglucosamine transferase (SPINDLY family)